MQTGIAHSRTKEQADRHSELPGSQITNTLVPSAWRKGTGLAQSWSKEYSARHAGERLSPCNTGYSKRNAARPGDFLPIFSRSCGTSFSQANPRALHKDRGGLTQGLRGPGFPKGAIGRHKYLHTAGCPTRSAARSGDFLPIFSRSCGAFFSQIGHAPYIADVADKTGASAVLTQGVIGRHKYLHVAGYPTRIDLGGILDTKVEKLIEELKQLEQEEYSQLYLAIQRSFGDGRQSAAHLGAANAYGRAARLVKDYFGSAPEK